MIDSNWYLNWISVAIDHEKGQNMDWPTAVAVSTAAICVTAMFIAVMKWGGK